MAHGVDRRSIHDKTLLDFYYELVLSSREVYILYTAYRKRKSRNAKSTQTS